ncbi:MAG: hypothetical protein M0Z82_02510 [Actinomycetota bacterium]|nr:hypothetical protein [Actinomycetota bacterium]
MAISVFAIGDIRRESFGSENGWSDQRMTGRDARIDEPNDRRSRARWVYRRQVVEIQGEELRWCQRWAGQDIKPSDDVERCELPNTAGRCIYPGQDDTSLVAGVCVGDPPSGGGDSVAEEVGPCVGECSIVGVPQFDVETQFAIRGRLGDDLAERLGDAVVRSERSNGVDGIDKGRVRFACVAGWDATGALVQTLEESGHLRVVGKRHDHGLVRRVQHLQPGAAELV